MFTAVQSYLKTKTNFKMPVKSQFCIQGEMERDKLVYVSRGKLGVWGGLFVLLKFRLHISEGLFS